MGKMNYPVDLTPDDNGTILATLPDVPGAITFGGDEAEALSNAVDALESVVSALIADRRDIPGPSPARGRKTVAPTLLGSLVARRTAGLTGHGRRARGACRPGLRP